MKEPKHQQHTPMRFNPYNGLQFDYEMHVASYRNVSAARVWHYNPWTGAQRDPRDIESDPTGLLIIPPGEQIYADAPPVTAEEDEMFSNFKPALDVQVGGDHYKDMKIQPVEFIHANGIGFFEGNVISYVSRWRKKNGIEDLKKAKHFIDLLIDLETAAQK